MGGNGGGGRYHKPQITMGQAFVGLACLAIVLCALSLMAWGAMQLPDGG